MFAKSNVEIVFGPKVKEVEGGVDAGGFYNCKYLKKLFFPTLFRIGRSGFTGCSSIRQLNLPQL
jgi:hypothetical protein